jgi:ribonuclease P protein component
VPRDVPGSRFKFSHRHRLAGKKTFQSVFDHSHKIAHKSLLVFYSPNQKSYARLGILITKQKIAQAVNRNRIRRRIRESFRHHKDLLKGLDLIILVRSKWCPTNELMRDDIDTLWPRLTDTLKRV